MRFACGTDFTLERCPAPAQSPTGAAAPRRVLLQLGWRRGRCPQAHWRRAAGGHRSARAPAQPTLPHLALACRGTARSGDRTGHPAAAAGWERPGVQQQHHRSHAGARARARARACAALLRRASTRRAHTPHRWMPAHAAAARPAMRLQAHGRNIDAALTAAQRAEALAFRALIDARLNPATMFTVWAEARGFEEFRKVGGRAGGRVPGTQTCRRPRGSGGWQLISVGAMAMPVPCYVVMGCPGRQVQNGCHPEPWLWCSGRRVQTGCHPEHPAVMGVPSRGSHPRWPPPLPAGSIPGGCVPAQLGGALDAAARDAAADRRCRGAAGAPAAHPASCMQQQVWRASRFTHAAATPPHRQPTRQPCGRPAAAAQGPPCPPARPVTHSPVARLAPLTAQRRRHGRGRVQVYGDALEALDACADKLRSSPGTYLGGAKPSSADAFLFGHLAFYLHSPVAAPVLKSKVRERVAGRGSCAPHLHNGRRAQRAAGAFAWAVAKQWSPWGCVAVQVQVMWRTLAACATADAGGRSALAATCARCPPRLAGCRCSPRQRWPCTWRRC
jgi:hypothetical protein